MSGIDLLNVLVLVGGGWLVASCIAMVALLSIHDAERRQPRYAFDEPQPDAGLGHRAQPTADRSPSSPGTGDGGAQGPDAETVDRLYAAAGPQGRKR